MYQNLRLTCPVRSTHEVDSQSRYYGNKLARLLIFSRQASLARQAFLITPLHGARYKTEKNANAKSSAM